MDFLFLSHFLPLGFSCLLLVAFILTFGFGQFVIELSAGFHVIYSEFEYRYIVLSCLCDLLKWFKSKVRMAATKVRYPGFTSHCCHQGSILGFHLSLLPPRFDTWVWPLTTSTKVRYPGFISHCCHQGLILGFHLSLLPFKGSITGSRHLRWSFGHQVWQS